MALRGRIGFACATARAFASRGFAPVRLLGPALARLRVKRAIHTMDTSQSTRPARLVLAHRKGERKKTRKREVEEESIQTDTPRGSRARNPFTIPCEFSFFRDYV